MGQLAAAVQDRVAPFLGFCGGAQILALLEARRFWSTREDDLRTIDQVLQRMTDALDPPAHEPHYRDPADSATKAPGLVPEALQTFAAKAVIDALTVQTRSIERAVAALELEPIAFEGSDSLDNPEAVFQ